MRIMIVDNSPVIRMSLRSLLHTIPDVEIVGEAANGQEAVEMVQTLLPDIVLMDVEMPVLNGLRAAAEITAANPDTRLIMLSLYGNTSFIREAFQNGAKAYLLKTELLTALPTVLQTVANGNIYAPEVEA